MNPLTAGRRARWTAVVIVAPAAATGFGIATAWAARTPNPVSKPAATPASARAVSPDATSLASARARSAAEQRKVAALQRQLADLRRKLAQATAGGGAASVVTDQAPQTSTVPPEPVSPAAPAAQLRTSANVYTPPPATSARPAAPATTSAAPRTSTAPAPVQTTSAAPAPPIQTISGGSGP